MQGEVESEGPSESECRPFIEKALKELEAGDAGTVGDSKEDVPTVEITTDDSDRDGDDDAPFGKESAESTENDQKDDSRSAEEAPPVKLPQTSGLTAIF